MAFGQSFLCFNPFVDGYKTKHFVAENGVAAGREFVIEFVLVYPKNEHVIIVRNDLFVDVFVSRLRFSRNLALKEIHERIALLCRVILELLVFYGSDTHAVKQVQAGLEPKEIHELVDDLLVDGILRC
jgi:hypothetical protein